LKLGGKTSPKELAAIFILLSIKTRIETADLSREPDPRNIIFILLSIKTRIETSDNLIHHHD